jgi:DNA-binding PadR family transcriptional regulator
VQLAFAPRGLLKVLILKLASAQPINGTEISANIQKLTHGLWRPSPGSIYYILNELLSREMITEIPTSEASVRRYISTQKGMDEVTRFKREGTHILAKYMFSSKLAAELLGFTEVSQKLEELVRKVEASHR